MSVQLHPAAEIELNHAIDWYDLQVIGLGSDFLAEVDRWLLLMGEAPEVCPLWSSAPRMDPPVRRVVMDRFPYCIAFQVYSEQIRILAFAHASRRPFYWVDRAGS